jgi:hypothetical protein
MQTTAEEVVSSMPIPNTLTGTGLPGIIRVVTALDRGHLTSVGRYPVLSTGVPVPVPVFNAIHWFVCLEELTKLPQISWSPSWTWCPIS